MYPVYRGRVQLYLSIYPNCIHCIPGVRRDSVQWLQRAGTAVSIYVPNCIHCIPGVRRDSVPRLQRAGTAASVVPATRDSSAMLKVKERALSQAVQSFFV